MKYSGMGRGKKESQDTTVLNDTRKATHTILKLKEWLYWPDIGNI